MLSRNAYCSYLSSDGHSLGEARRRQSAKIIDYTFTNDPNHKKVRVLTQDGWILMDAKYQYHQTQSIAKDGVDWYLQFRPGVHFPIGTYVIIPDDDDDRVPTFEDEVEFFKNHEENLADHEYSRLWFIVNRDRAMSFVRYNVLQCNWNFQWIYDGKIQNCYGALRDSNSYTSGIWRSDYTNTLDNTTAAWLPDIHAIYQKTYKNLGLCDNRTISHEQRFMLTNNSIHPNVYAVSKVKDMSPQGVIKITFKQDEFDNIRDNVSLRICDYYENTGTVTHDEPYHFEHDVNQIVSMKIENGKVTEGDVISNITISIGGECYLGLHDWNYDWEPDWRLSLDEDSVDTKKPSYYYEGLLKVDVLGKTNIRIKAAKAPSLIGKKFTLCVCDMNGYSHSSIKVEVTDAT